MDAYLREAWVSQVHEALLASAVPVEPIVSGRWKLVPRWRLDQSVVVSIQEDWLCFDAAFDSRSSALNTGEGLWAVMECNRRLPAGLRSALRPAAPSLALRADIGLDDEDTVPDRIAQVCAALPDAAETVCAARSGSRSCRRGDAADWRSPGETEDVSGLCEEAGWKSTVRPGGVSVPLDVPGESRSAIVSSDCGVRTYAPLIQCDGLAERSRMAIGVLLLTASWLVYLARPTASADAGSGWQTVAIEVAFGQKPTAVELDRALKALSVGCRLCARELPALQNPAVADAYLAVRGWD